jgi:hypothetical protein
MLNMKTEIRLDKISSFEFFHFFLTSPPSLSPKERGAIHLKIKILDVIISPPFQGGE